VRRCTHQQAKHHSCDAARMAAGTCSASSPAI
jgi:hypothetical protein